MVIGTIVVFHGQKFYDVTNITTSGPIMSFIEAEYYARTGEHITASD